MKILPENDCLSTNVSPVRESLMQDVRMTKVTLSELRNISTSLTKILSLDMPIKEAYRMTKMAKSVDNELKMLEDLRIGLVKKYGQVDEQGNIAVKDNMQIFVSELNKLLTEQVEIAYIPIKLDNLGEIKVSPIDLMYIDMFLDKEAP